MTFLDRPDQCRRIRFIGEHVHTRLECFRIAFFLCKILQSPPHLVDDARIRVDVALEAEFTAQNVLYDDFVVGESGLFKEAAVRKLHCAVRVARVGIIGHDRSGSRFNRRFERWYMIVIKAARCRIWIEAAPRIMGIMPPVPCTPAWEMLRRNGYTPVPQSVTL